MSFSHNPEPGIVKAVEGLQASAEKMSASTTRLTWAMFMIAIVQTAISVAQLFFK